MTYVRAFEHRSDLLAGNPMGNSPQRRIHVYLPPNYSDRRREPYPVVFMLSGWGGRGANYLSDGGVFGSTLADRLDQWIDTKRMPPCIVIFPDGSSRLGCSQYVNSSSNGPFMDYMCDEVVDWVDRRFHTHKSRDFRGVIGHSSGGFGALVFGMLRADRFGSICSSAGDSFYERLYTSDIPVVVNTVAKAGGIEPFVRRFLENPNPLGLMGHAAVLTMLYLSIGTCFLPNPQIPVIQGELWFDLETGALQDDNFTRLLAWDPVRMIDTHLTSLKSLHWIHLQCGSDDEYGLQLGHRQIAAKLAAQNIPYTLEEYPGKHGGHHHHMPDRIKRMVESMLG